MALIILTFIFLLFLSGAFSATEIAFFSLRPSRVKMLADKKDARGKRVYKLLQKPDDLLITILIGNNIVNTFTASFAAVITTDLVGSSGLGIATGTVTFLILVFGEITPKAFAQKNNEWFAVRMAPVLFFLMYAFKPVVWLLRFVTRTILKPFTKNLSEDSHIHKEELVALSKLAHQSGTVEPEEHEIIENVLDFAHLQIKDVFLPIHKVILLNGNVPVEQIAHFMSVQGYSRYPVYDGDEDDVVGYVHANDVMRVLNSAEREKPLKDIVRKITTVRPTDIVERVFRKMKRTHEHLILVIGSKDQPLGIVTIGDIMEELLGDIDSEIEKERGLIE